MVVIVIKNRHHCTRDKPISAESFLTDAEEYNSYNQNSINSDNSDMKSAVISGPAALCWKRTCTSRRGAAGSDGGNCVRCSRRGAAGSDGGNCVRCSRRGAAGSDGGNCVRCSRRGDAAHPGSLPMSRPKRECSNIVIIASLIAVCLLPEGSAANPTGINSTSSSWNPTGDNSIRKQTPNILRNSTRGLFLLYRRGDNDNEFSLGNNSSLAVPTQPIQHVLLGDGVRNASKEKAISAANAPREDDTASKIINIVVPFTCVILVAGSLVAAYKLCYRYRCYKHEAGLRKCLAFCDRCLSTPYVFQLPDDKKDPTSPVSSDSSRLFRYSLNSVSSSSSRTSTTLSPLANHTVRNDGLKPTAKYTPIRHSSSSSLHSSASRHASTSSKNSVRSISSRQNSTLTLVSNAASIGSALVYQNPRQPETRLQTSGRLPRPGFHLSRPSLTPSSSRPSLTPSSSRPSLTPSSSRPSLTPSSSRPSLTPSSSRPSLTPNSSRPSLTPGSSRASVPSRGSVQSRRQAHRAPGGITRRQNSTR